MTSYRAFVGLGSNLGDRGGYLNAAVAALKRAQDLRVIWASPVYESDPYGGVEQPRFLNAVVEIETTLEPARLLPVLKGIEEAAGRRRSDRWGPREIDLDILLYDGHVYTGPNLTVPHAELERRRFVLLPLSDLAPDVIHPVLGETMAELLRSCRDTTRIVRSQHHIVI